MLRAITTLLGAGALCLTSAAASGQGPIDGYMKGKGDLDVALGLSATGASTLIGGGGETIRQEFRGQLIGLFAAYGVSDDLDVVASVPYVTTATTSGLQDGGVYAKYRLWSKPIGNAESRAGTLDVIAAAGVQVPLSDYEVVANGAIGQRAKLVQPRLVTQWNGRGYFVSAIAGYNYRFDGLDTQELARIQLTRPGYQPAQPADQVTALFRAGIPTQRFYLDAWLEIQRTLGGESFDSELLQLVQTYDVDYQQVGGTVYYSETAHWGFAGSAARVIGGRNTSEFWRVTGTVVYKLLARQLLSC